MSAIQIAFSTQMDLQVPDKIGLEAIYVKIDIEPPGAGCILYGWSDDGNLQTVVIHESTAEAELLFVYPHIWIAYSEGITKFKIKTVGWAEAKGPRFSPPLIDAPPSRPLH
jgi:hypothetical protein